MMTDLTWHRYQSKEQLAAALAQRVAERLSSAIKARGNALLAVSGGTTPALFFRELSRQELEWDLVTVTLVDERFVPPSSERSNARLVQEHLLQNDAKGANFVPLFHEVRSAEDAAEKANQAISSLPLPIDVAVLGMGLDGHTASFFPDAEDLSSLLAEENRLVLPVHAPSAGEPRLTLSVPLLCGAALTVLHIEGEEKKRVLEDARARDNELEAPILAILRRSAEPVETYWAP